jgi:hypothetical protein
MSGDAGAAVHAAMIAALMARRELNDIDGRDGASGSAVLPRIVIEPGPITDWSTKDVRGREVRTIVSVRVAKGQMLRLPSLSAAIETAGTAIGGDIGGWSVGSAILLRTRVSDASDGTRTAIVEHRVRVLEI